MYLRFKDGKEKALTLSYDDGFIFDKQLIEIIDKYGLKGTFNINTGLYAPERKNEVLSGRMSLSEAQKLYINSGHEVAVHALTHPFLEQLSHTELIHEIIEDRKNIERDFKTIARGMAYPFGTYNNEVVDILKKCGIEYSRTVRSTHSFNLPENWLTLHPTCHHTDTELISLAQTFVEESSPWGLPQLFYLWGHSYEFNNDNNWNVIEEFAEYIGNRENIWYATNIEIYDYVQAFNSLKTSYDMRTIYNPSATTIWFFSFGETHEIHPGETLTL